MFSGSLKLNKKDYYFLIATLILSIILVSYYINFTLNIGLFCSDVYVYLVNALFFCGKHLTVGNDIWLSPVVCLFTAFFYYLGIHSTLSIMLVNGILAIIGNIGMYLFLRYKFEPIYSLFGTVTYTTFSLYLIWLGNGTLDIPSVCFTIWAVLFCVIAIDKNPKYYIPFAITVVLGFFIRYPVILIVPPLLLYFVFEKYGNISKVEIKYIILGLIVGIISALIIILPLASLNSWDISFISQGSSFVGGATGSLQDPAYNTNSFYYIENSLNFLNSGHTDFIKGNPNLQYPTAISYIFLAILIVGGLVTIDDNLETKISKKLVVLTLIFAVLTIIGFLKLTSTYTIILMLITFLLAGFAIKTLKFDYNMMMVAWFLIYLIFYSYLHFKVNRYFIPCLPVVAYFISYGLYKIQTRIKINKNIIPAILIVVLVAFSFYYTETVETTKDFNAPSEVYEYVITNYPDYKDLNIGSSTVRPFNWYFDSDLAAYKNDEVTQINHSDLDLYLSNKRIDGLYNFREVKTIDDYVIYERI